MEIDTLSWPVPSEYRQDGGLEGEPCTHICSRPTQKSLGNAEKLTFEDKIRRNNK